MTCAAIQEQNAFYGCIISAQGKAIILATVQLAIGNI